MLTTIRNKINKPFNASFIIKEIDSINDEVIKPLLYSQFVNEGVYGLESIINNNKSQIYIFAPSYEKIKGREIDKNKYWFIDQLDNFHVYQIILNNPSFLPLNTDINLNLFQELSKIDSLNTQIFIQLLLTKQTNNWRDIFTEQYYSFLNGNNIPASNTIIRQIQENIIVTLDNIVKNTTKRDKIKEIEEKIIDNGYRTEIRLVLHSDNVSKIRSIENSIAIILNKITGFNNLRLVKFKTTNKFISNIIHKQFSKISKNQILSAAEIKSLLLLEKSSIQENSPQSNVEIKQIKPITNDYSKLINLLPDNKAKPREIDKTIGDKLANALRRVGVIKNQEVIVNKIEQGVTLQKITIKLPDNINYSDIKKNIENLNVALGTDALSIEQGDEPETISFLIPANEKEIVYLKKLLESKDFLKYANEHALPIVLGVDILGNPIFEDLTRIKHLLVAGATGSGKSVFLNTLILTLLIIRKPEDIILYLIDPKKVEFTQYHEFPHVKDIITDMNRASLLLKSLIFEMEKRYDKFAELGCKDIEIYNKKSKTKLPYVVCIIDEFNDLMMVSPGEIEDFVIRLAQKARAAGIHIIIGTQRPEEKVVTGLIKANLPSKISFRLDNVNDYRTIFGKGIPYYLLGNGDGVMRLEGQIKEFIRFQSSILTPNTEEEFEICNKLKLSIKNEYKNEAVNGIEIIKEQLPIEKLKKIIANTGEVRISKLREMMGIRSNDLQELMQQLVIEAWLEEPKNKRSGYQLIISEEILNEWRDD